MICECYKAEKNFLGKVGLCWGTAERDACSCGGNKSKCDFYPTVREEGKKPVTHYDLLIRKTPEELAEFIGSDPLHDICPNNCQNDFERPCKVCVLNWLKQEAE